MSHFQLSMSQFLLQRYHGCQIHRCLPNLCRPGHSFTNNMCCWWLYSKEYTPMEFLHNKQRKYHVVVLWVLSPQNLYFVNIFRGKDISSRNTPIYYRLLLLWDCHCWTSSRVTVEGQVNECWGRIGKWGGVYAFYRYNVVLWR